MSDPRRLPRALFWSLGGGVALVTLVVALRILGSAAGGRAHTVGDGRDPASYGFDLDPCLVPRETLVCSGLPRDGLVALDRPPPLNLAGVDSLTAAMRGKYLVSTDRVVGMVIDGCARAWPLRVLDWHEVINDTLGGRAVAVTWSPLTGSVRAFDRRVDGQDLVFGVSGLLADGNLLFYARSDTLSLWSQLAGRAVTGPAAARERALQDLPIVVCDWAAWRARHPDTTVPLPAREYRKRYGSDPYFSYRHGHALKYPVSVPAPVDALAPLLVVRDASGLVLIDTAAVADEVGEGGLWALERPTGVLRFKVGTTLGVGVPGLWIDGAESRDDIRVWPVYRYAARAFRIGIEEVRP